MFMLRYNVGVCIFSIHFVREHKNNSIQLLHFALQKGDLFDSVFFFSLKIIQVHEKIVCHNCLAFGMYHYDWIKRWGECVLFDSQWKKNHWEHHKGMNFFLAGIWILPFSGCKFSKVFHSTLVTSFCPIHFGLKSIKFNVLFGNDFLASYKTHQFFFYTENVLYPFKWCL